MLLNTIKSVALRRISRSNLLAPICPSTQVYLSQRNISLHEYQSKKIFEDNGLNVQRFRLVTKYDEALTASNDLMNTIAKELVIKAQILAGGRGKGVFSNGFKGGVHLTKDPQYAAEISAKMLNNRLITKQTGEDGVLVQKLMIAEALDIKKETYFAIVLDRDSGGAVLVGSPIGGMDIEHVAETQPDKIFKENIDIMTGLTKDQAQTMAKNLGFEGKNLDIAVDQMLKLYKLFIKTDALQIEINPFGETPDGRVVCFDAKLNIDDNAKFRQQPIFSQEDFSETDRRELEAIKAGLNYIQMDGNIGCLVNGAGLAMATMDLISLYGGSPANFLDVGGNVKEDQVYEAFRILSSDAQVKAILVNIFGGIVNCATIANGIKNALKKKQLQIPLIVRLQGTNMDEGNRILSQSGLNVIAAPDFSEAAKLACSVVKK